VRDFREPFHVRLVRGESRGPASVLLRLLLTPPSWAWAAAADLRFALYKSGVFSRHRVPCPVISVGNLTAGGTGKTPLVEWVVRELRLFGRNPAVLSRGYGATEGETPDEQATLDENLTDLRYVRDADRVRGALKAIERFCADSIVLDDGFQHFRLARQLDLVSVDATCPFGGGHCLPRGTLREPFRALRRAGAIVLTRTDQVGPREVERIFRKLRRVGGRASFATTIHAPHAVRPLAGGADLPPGRLAGLKAYAVSGIGNPAAFERTLASLGCRVVGTARFPDHHRYRAEDIRELAGAAETAGADAIVTTQKDAVKWKNGASGVPAYSLVVRIRFTSGEEQVRERLRGALRGGVSPESCIS
jgi:tetraacyldisaccharide 4'-kinase